jgi:hypothetical protein
LFMLPAKIYEIFHIAIKKGRKVKINLLLSRTNYKTTHIIYKSSTK